MATVVIERLPVPDAGLREELRQAAATGGRAYELALGGAIAKRRLPVLARIEAETATPIIGVSMARTRGPRSSQSRAWFQWQRGHRKDGTRWPDATIEFVGAGSVVTQLYALEITLQADITRIGNSRACSMSMGKASQITLTATLLAAKPSYRDAAIEYWYLCPWEPVQETQIDLLTPLRNMRGTDRVRLTWVVVDHGG